MHRFSAILLLVAGLFSSTAAQTDCTVTNDNWQSLQLTITVGDIQTAGTDFQTLAIDGLQPSSRVGAPQLPLFSHLIEVPLCKGFDIDITDDEYDTLQLDGSLVMPAQSPRSKSDTAWHPMEIDRSIYSKDAYYGETPATVEAIGIARDRRLARLQFAPVRYNPVQNKLIICRKAKLTISYRGADPEATLEMFERYHSPAFNSGAQTLNDLYPKAVRTTAPVRYVIVANSMFRGHLDDFVQWKRRKGFMTDIVYTDNPSVGNTTSSIQTYLRGLYTDATTASPAPTYVLLVGDVAQLPAFSAQVTSPSSDHVTDLYYMTWTVGDHLPDCHYGRFSAQTVAQLTPQVQKTLMYEQYTFADPSFLDRAVMVAGVDGGSAGDFGYTHADPAMDYAIINYVNGAHGFANVYYFKNDVSIVPTGVTNVTVSSSASGNSAVVRQYYNLGAGLINYSAHGGSTGWGTPNFGNSHVAQMTNVQKFGLMIGNCCLTNKFEESTCFGEALLRKDNYCGAVGYIGGSNSTYWSQDFYWAVGIRSNIGPNMSMDHQRQRRAPLRHRHTVRHRGTLRLRGTHRHRYRQPRRRRLCQQLRRRHPLAACQPPGRRLYYRRLGPAVSHHLPLRRHHTPRRSLSRGNRHRLRSSQRRRHRASSHPCREPGQRDRPQHRAQYLVAQSDAHFHHPDGDPRQPSLRFNRYNGRNEPSS